jgi:hypothetical protein
MSLDDFNKLIARAQDRIKEFPSDSDDELMDLEARVGLYEEFIRYIAKGGVNQFHAMKIARAIMNGVNIEKQSPK